MTLRCEELRRGVLGYTPFDRMPRSWQEIGKVPLISEGACSSRRRTIRHINHSQHDGLQPLVEHV